MKNTLKTCLWRGVWRYQREVIRIRKWSKVQKDKPRSTNHTNKTKDQVTRTLLKTWGELRCSERVSSSCSTSDIRRFNLATTFQKQSMNFQPVGMILYTINVKRNRRGNQERTIQRNWRSNQEWTIQRHWQHWADKTVDEHKAKKNQTT